MFKLRVRCSCGLVFPPQNWINPETNGKHFIVFRRGVWQIGLVEELSIPPITTWSTLYVFAYSKFENDMNPQTPDPYILKTGGTGGTEWKKKYLYRYG